MAYIGAGITRFNTADELTVTGDAQIDTTTLVVDSTNNRVGIGTSSPSTNLEINGGANNNIVRIVSTDANANIEFADNTTTSGLSIGANGDNMKFGISGTEAMRITSAGLVGIGTSSPDETAQIFQTATVGNDYNEGTLKVGGSSTVLGFQMGYHSISSGRNVITSLNNAGGANQRISIGFGAVNSSGEPATNVMTLNQSGLVGIGTSSPATATGGGIDIERGGGASVRLDDTTNSVTGEMQVYSAGMNLATVTNHNIIISTNNTQRMSIASGGDVAFGNSVANTVSNYNNQPGGGFVASDSHFEFATTSNRAPVEIGKNNANDGQLVVLRKQNTTVGSIVYSSATNIALGNASKGIGIGTGSVFPTNGSTAISDAGLDLGYSSSRWKDLYLSGGVYLGGTASANLLDDYESGSWTVNLYKGGSALAVTTRYGYYRRVGDLLHISFYWLNSSITTTGGSSYTIQGMPFNLLASNNGAYQFCPVGYNSIDSNNVHRWQVNSSTELLLYGAGQATNVSSGLLEFSGTGVFRIS